MNIEKVGVLAAIIASGFGIWNIIATRRAEEDKAAIFIAENPKSIAALKVNDPVAYSKAVKSGEEYSSAKASAFNSLSPQQRRSYRGGF